MSMASGKVNDLIVNLKYAIQNLLSNPTFEVQIELMIYRIEKDTMGEVKVPSHVYWGAQTQRSIENFKIAQDINKMPKPIIEAFAYLKKAAALANFELGVLSEEKCDAITRVCDEILGGTLDDQFPLVVWQTGS